MPPKSEEADAEFRRGVGSRIRQARTMRGLSLNGLGSAANTHLSQVVRFEKGARLPDASTIVRLAAALEVSIDWILTGRDFAGRKLVPSSPPLSLPPGLEMTLSGFLQAVTNSGLAHWAATASKKQSPTLGEALEALEVLKGLETLDVAPDGPGVDLTWALRRSC